ncbi:Ubiquitin conjugation factor E4 [Schizosaccharomyces pombe]
MSDLEKIRLKRLAKLQQTNSEANSSKEPKESNIAPEPKKPDLKKRFSGSKATTSNSEQKEISPPVTSGAPKHRLFSKDEWMHFITCQALNITLSETDSSKYYLEGFKKDLEEEGSPLLFNENNVDSALLSRLSTTGNNTFSYLLQSWSFLYQYKKRLPKDENQDFKIHYLSLLKSLLVSYAGIVVMLPDTFNSETIDLAEVLIGAEGIPLEFLSEFVQRFEHENLDELFIPVLESLSLKIGLMNVDTVQMNVMQIILQLVSLKPIALLLPKLPSWNPTNNAGEIEYKTFLGRISSLSVFTQDVASRYFSNSTERSAQNISSSISSLKLTMSTYQDVLFQIFNTLIRTSTSLRESVLDFFAMVVNANHKRQSIQVNHFDITSDACMLNFSHVLSRLSEPFLDIGCSKIDRVQVEYFRRNPRVDIKEETKLNADQKASESFYSKPAEGSNNFISDIFFLNLAFHHYGVNATFKALEQLVQSIRDSEKLKERLETEQQNMSGSFQATRLTAQLSRLDQRLDLDRSFVHCYEIMLTQTSDTSRSFSFLNFVAIWLSRLADGQSSTYPKMPLSLPFNENAPEAFKCLPEYFIETITDYMLSLFKTSSSTLTLHSLEPLCEFCVSFLTQANYIKNPYLRAKLVEILYFGVQTHVGRSELLLDVVRTSKVATRWLLPALMAFYIEIESTGQSTQFYDKFNIRFYICEVFRTIWKQPAYFGKLEQEQKTNLPFFVKFVALMLNDATYLLDEALLKLTEIHNLQSLLADAISNSNSNQNVQESQSNLAAAERQASTYCQLGNETIFMLKLFTSSIPKAFCAVEIVDRLAAMLNYNLQALCGPKCSNLKVEDPTKYHFNAKTLLSIIFDVYLNLCNEPAFVEAVAHDGRSYSKEIFERATSIMTKHNLKSSFDIEAIKEFVNRVEAFRLQEATEEEDMGDIPDYFLDPLMFTIMKDPVVLPRSGISIDRSTIKAHLLSDATDPFNRTPLTLDDVTPNDTLREEINTFLKSKRNKHSRNSE